MKKVRRRGLSIIMAVLFVAETLLNPCGVQAAAAEPEGVVEGTKGEEFGAYNYESAADGSGVVITAYLGGGGEVEIPSEINGQPVTGIGEHVFTDNVSLTSVTLPEYLAEIKEGAFSGCTALTDIQFPKSLKKIGKDAFSGCTALTWTKFPRELESIGSGAFSNCAFTGVLELPGTLTSLGSMAFSGCTGMTWVRLPEGIEKIEKATFSGCTGLLKVNLPVSLSVIGNEAFKDCSDLTDVYYIGTEDQWGEITIGSLNDVLQSVSFHFGTIEVASVELDQETLDLYIDETAQLSAAVLPEEASDQSVTWASTDENVAQVDQDGKVTACGKGTTQITAAAKNGMSAACEVTVRKGGRKNGLKYEIFEDEGTEKVKIIGYEGTDEQVSIPMQIEERWVVSIGSGAFLDCSALKGIYIPHTITTLEDAAFENCTSLEKLQFNGGLESIGNSAFKNCTSLHSVTYLKSKSIGDAAFEGCTSLESVEMEEDLESIGSRAFSGCSSLKRIKLPESLTKIGEGAFLDCQRLADVYYTGKKNGWGAVRIEEGNEPLTGAALHCEAASYIGVSSLELDEEEIELTVGETFQLTATVLPEDATYKIVQWSSDNESAASVDQDGLVTALEKGTAYIMAQADGYGYSRQCYVTVKDLSLENGLEYKIVQGEEGEGEKIEITGYTGTEEELEIPDQIGEKPVSSIGGGAFSGCSALTDIKLPKDLASIGWAAFYECRGLTGIKLPENVEEIKDQAFYGCANLADAELPDHLKTIGVQAFASCGSLTGIKLPDGLVSIGSQAFASCGSLTGIELPDGLAFIGDQAFYDCSSLSYIEIPGSMEVVDDRAFYECSGLTGLKLQEGVKTIGSRAFAWCGSLREVVLPESLEEIGSDAFYGSSVTDVYYAGDEYGWNRIQMGGSDLSGAEIHYGSTGPEAESVSLNQEELTLKVGETFELVATVLPENAQDKSVTWTSDSESVAGVSADGLVTAAGEGSATITAETANGKTAFCEVTVNAKEAGNTGNWEGLEYTVLNDGSIQITGYSGTGTFIEIPAEIEEKPVTSIGFQAFQDNTSIQGVVLPEGIKRIGADAFWGCTSLGTVELPEGLEEIGSWAFYDCSSLAVIELPEGIARIEMATFYNCTGMEKIMLPQSLGEIDNYAFINCSGLKEVYYAGTREQWTAVVVGSENDCLTNAEFYYDYRNIQPESLSLDKTELVLELGEETQITAAVLPKNADQTVTWSTTNKYVVDGGLLDDGSLWIYGVGEGSAVIKAKTVNGIEASCTVTVVKKKVEVSSVKLNKTSLKIEALSSSQLTATVLPSDATDKSLSWTTSNPHVADLYQKSGSIYVYGVGAGSATITVTAQNGKKATCQVTVSRLELKIGKVSAKLTGANKVRLSWKKVSGATEYYVYRCVKGAASYTRIKKVKGTSCTDSELKSGKTYQYEVLPWNSKLLGGSPGKTMETKYTGYNIWADDSYTTYVMHMNFSRPVTKKALEKLKTPALSQKINGWERKFTLSWKQIKNAQKIQIYRKKNNGKWKKWKTVSAKKGKVTYSCRGFASGKWQFRLRAFYKKDGITVYSDYSRSVGFRLKG